MTAFCSTSCDRRLLDTELAIGQLLCSPCVDRMGVWLRELPLQITVLEGSRQRETTGASSGGRTVHRTAPLPGRSDVLNLLGPATWGEVHDADRDQHGHLSIAGTLIPWVRLITEERRWNPPLSHSPQALAAWLSHPRPLSWASRRPWGGDMRDELDALMRTVRDTTRLRPRRRAITQPCPRCDSLTLVETDHQLYVECGICESMFTREELALAARIAVASQQLVAGAERVA